MKVNKNKLLLIKQDGEISYCSFTPHIFEQYYLLESRNDWPDIFKRAGHKIRNVQHILGGRSRILYMIKNEEIVALLSYDYMGESVMSGTTDRDVFVRFIWTAPTERGKGFANKLMHFFLHESGIDYKRAYETIALDNLPSINVAKRNGYVSLGRGCKNRITGRWRICNSGYAAIWCYEKKDSP